MSGDSWKLTAFAPRETIRAALVEQEEVEEWDPEIVLTGFEISEDRPDDWRLDAYFPRKPSRADRATISHLFTGHAPRMISERLPQEDWVTKSQQGFAPIRAGRFQVRSPDYSAPDAARFIDLVIPASQAFGTGQHATTAGCLAMLDAMKRRGLVVRNLADIGTGTGLLAFAALALWPRALATASDIDPVCLSVVMDNARINGIPMGAARGHLTMVSAAGMDHSLLTARSPFDLLIANILAEPLLELAGDFAKALKPGGNLLLAGLLERQEPVIRSAYRRAGFRLAARAVNGDWSILWLRRRR